MKVLYNERYCIYCGINWVCVYKAQTQVIYRLYERGVAMSWVTDITDAITSTFTALGNGIINFVKDGFTNLFFETNASNEITGLSNFAIFGFVIMGVSVVMGLTYFIVNLVRRKL